MQPRTPPSWTDIFLAQCRVIAARSKDPSTQHGALLADRHRRVVSQGFNGPPRRIPDHAVPWERPAKYAWVIHAEENAILFGLAARGIGGLEDCTLYVTGPPCSRCMLRVVHAGIGRVVYGDRGSACVDAEDWALARRIAELGEVELIAHGPSQDAGLEGPP
jgi:dCMP deaminase